VISILALLWNVGNVISIVVNIFAILTISSWETIPFIDRTGTMHNLNLDTGGLVFLSLLKILVNGLFIKWGIETRRVYKPI